MGKEVIEKEFRVRGRISPQGEYWTHDRPNAGSRFGKGTNYSLPNDIKYLDFKIQIMREPKVFKDDWTVIFKPDEKLEPANHHPVYQIMGVGYDKKKTETELDLANKFLSFINSRQQLTSYNSYFAPIILDDGVSFAKYWLGETVEFYEYESIEPDKTGTSNGGTSSGTASTSGSLPFFEILGEYTDDVPPVPAGYFDKWDEFVKKLFALKKKENRRDRVGATASATGKLIKDFKFNVETENVFKLVGGTGSAFDTLTILSKTQSIAETQTANDFSYNDTSEELDDEYSEEATQIEDPNAYATVSEVVVVQLMQEADKAREEALAAGANGGSAQSGAIIPMAGGGSMTGKVNIDYKKKGSNWGRVKKGMTDAELLRAMVTYIEGGYYYPGHAYSKFSASARELYGASGETLWGIDRCAGQTEDTPEGKAFWGEVDKLSGYGPTTGTTGYSKKTKTREWNNSQYPTIASAWGYNYSPQPGSPGYDIMYDSFVKYATGNLEKYLNKYFKGHPVKDLILGDTRFKFMWFRSTWNGPGWFEWYSNGSKKRNIEGIKWAYDNVTKNVDELIVWDLNNRLLFKTELITHDVRKMCELLGIG